MADDIYIFFEAKNVKHLSDLCAKIGFKPRCGLLRYMQEFISETYESDMPNFWNIANTDAILRKMNEKFMKYLKFALVREQRRNTSLHKSVAMDIANTLNPFGFATRVDEQYDFGHYTQPMTKNVYRDPKSPSEQLYARTERDQVGLMHLMARDDEASDPHFDQTEEIKYPFATRQRINEARRMTDRHLANISAPVDDAEPIP
jgi:hypothetical protein